MKLNIYLFVLSAVILVSACKKERLSVEEKITEPTIVEKEIRNELLAAVFDFANMEYPGKLQKFDLSGNLLWERITEAAATEFKRWTINGEYYYSYVLFDKNRPRMANVGYIPGPVVILDKDMNEIRKLYLLPNRGRTEAEVVDGHDFIMLDYDHYLTMAYVEKKVNNIPSDLNPHPDVRVVASIIQEVKNGEVVFEWDGTDYPEFYTSSREGNNFSDPTGVKDYHHINSMHIDPNDNNIIASFRNTDQVVKINRETGDVMWRLGGVNSSFPLTPDQYFLRQHHATITDDGKTLLLFDNGEEIMRPYSRILEFKLNEVRKTVNGFKAVSLPENVFCRYMASVQKTQTSYFIGAGSTPFIYEIDINTQAVLLKKELEGVSYRAYKY